MMELRDKVLDYTDEELLAAYEQRSEYTEDAVRIFDEEITRRCLDVTEMVAEKSREARKKLASATAGAAVKNLSREDFEALPCRFAKADVLLANAVLGDSNVPYTIEEYDDGNDTHSDDSDNRDDSGDEKKSAEFTVLIYKDALEKAAALIAEHFDEGADGVYVLRHTDVTDRLKAFSFSDIRLSDEAARERFDVDFSASERAAIVRLARMLLEEADKVEEEQERVVFFYDSLEPLVEKINNNERLTRPDFLAMIELCQVYCDDPRYDRELNQTVSSIIDFFLG